MRACCSLLLGLADAGIFGAALVDRHAQVQQRLSCDGAGPRVGRVVRACRLRLQAHLRHEGGELHVDVVASRGVVEQGGDHVRVVVRRELHRLALVLDRHLDRLRFDQPIRQLADILAVGAARGLQIALGGLARGSRTGQRRLGLRHVGSGDLADPEAVLRRLQLTRQHLLVVDVELQHLLRLDDVDVGVDRVGEHGLLGREQAGALAVGLCYPPGSCSPASTRHETMAALPLRRR